MNISKIRGVIPVVLVCLSVVACSKPFSTPDIEFSVPEPSAPSLPEQNHFNGIADYLYENDGNTKLRVLWVHGMCSQDTDWINKRLEVIKKTLLGPAFTETSQTMPDKGIKRIKRVKKIEKIELHTHEFMVGKKTLEVTFLHWSPLTKKHKEKLNFDSPDGGYPHSRAFVNNLVKARLVNDCLADAVIYLGSNGEAIKSAMQEALQEALCQVLGGKDEYDDKKSRMSCKPPSSVDNGQSLPPKPFVLVAESLGSKLLIDALGALRKKEKEAKNSEFMLMRALDKRRLTVFLLSNQIPLLDLADLPSGMEGSPEGSSLTSLTTLIDILIKQPTDDVSSQSDMVIENDFSLSSLEIVAFTDPNDLLSYGLQLKDVSNKNMSNKVKLVNVTVSNGWTYLNVFESPVTAHLGYRQNPEVLCLVVMGDRSDMCKFRYK